jgi:hypothetical protein
MIFARAADLKRAGLKTRHYGAGTRSRVRSSSLGAIGCSLVAMCRKFTVLLAKEGIEASYLRFRLGFLLGVQLSLQSREAIEEQLGDVGQSDSVAAGDTFAGELLGEIAEEEIHGTGGGEVLDLGEKFGGEDLGLHDGDSG